MAGESPLRSACAAANALTGVPGARLYRGRIASPAGFSAAEGIPPEDAARRLAARLSLAGTPFSSAEAESGYLNFTLSEEWFRALPSFWTETAAELPQEGVSFLETPVKDEAFPARYVPFDRVFLSLLRRQDSLSLCARQDAENPGWLVRYTLRRLADLRQRSGTQAAVQAEHAPVPDAVFVLTDAERELLLLAAELPGLDGRRRAQGVLALCQAVWAAAPQRLSTLSRETAELAIRDAAARCAGAGRESGETNPPAKNGQRETWRRV